MLQSAPGATEREREMAGADWPARVSERRRRDEVLKVLRRAGSDVQWPEEDKPDAQTITTLSSLLLESEQ